MRGKPHPGLQTQVCPIRKTIRLWVVSKIYIYIYMFFFFFSVIYLLLIEFFLTTTCALQMCIFDSRLPGVVVMGGAYIYIYIHDIYPEG